MSRNSMNNFISQPTSNEKKLPNKQKKTFVQKRQQKWIQNQFPQNRSQETSELEFNGRELKSIRFLFNESAP